MPIEEQAEEKIQNAVQTIITGGAKLMLRIPKGVAMALLRSGMKLTKTGVHAAGKAVKNKIDSGEMSEKRLQRKKDGDLHELQLDDSTMREVQHSLKTAGIDYHLERTDQGQFVLHFAGKDEDHVRHAVQRAFKNMGLDVADDDFTIDRTEQTRNEPEPPARETPAEPAAKPMPTQRIAWDFVDPEVMEMAANSLAARHPELSWDRLMGDTTCDERAGRDFADRIIGKAAADPRLRDELRHHPARRLRAGRANPGADTQADDRAKPGDAGIGAGRRTGTHAGRSPDTGHATADAGRNQRPQAGRQRAEAEADPVEEGTARTVQDPAQREPRRTEEPHATHPEQGPHAP